MYTELDALCFRPSGMCRIAFSLPGFGVRCNRELPLFQCERAGEVEPIYPIVHAYGSVT